MLRAEPPTAKKSKPAAPLPTAVSELNHRQEKATNALLARIGAELPSSPPDPPVTLADHLRQHMLADVLPSDAELWVLLVSKLEPGQPLWDGMMALAGLNATSHLVLCPVLYELRDKTGTVDDYGLQVLALPAHCANMAMARLAADVKDDVEIYAVSDFGRVLRKLTQQQEQHAQRARALRSAP